MIWYFDTDDKRLSEFEKLFEKVMKLDSTIRYAAIQNNVGEKIFGGFRDNINPILDENELKMMHHYASQRWQTRKNIEHKLGKNKYAIAEYDKIKRISIPLDEQHLLMLTTEISTDHTLLINRIRQLIESDYQN